MPLGVLEDDGLFEGMREESGMTTISSGPACVSAISVKKEIYFNTTLTQTFHTRTRIVLEKTLS